MNNIRFIFLSRVFTTQMLQLNRIILLQALAILLFNVCSQCTFWYVRFMENPWGPMTKNKKKKTSEPR